MAFPTSPTNGQTATINGIQYTYSSATNSWTRDASTLIGTVYNQANTGTVLAQAAFNSSNNKLNLSGGSLTGTLNTNSTINVTGNVMVETGYVSANNGVINVIQDSMGFVPYQPGLVWRRYNHTSASNINAADLTSAIANGTFVSQGVTSQVSGFTASAEAYIIEFSGYFYANTTGIFTFSIDSDDGSDLFIDGYAVADWYGAHSTGAAGSGNYRSMYLKRGYHRLYARLIEFSGGDVITLYYKSPITPAWTVIPGYLLYYDPKDLVRSGSSNTFTTDAIVSFSNTQTATSNTTGSLRVSGGISSSSGGFWVSNTSVISAPTGTNHLEIQEAGSGSVRFGFVRDVGSGSYITTTSGGIGFNILPNYGTGIVSDIKIADLTAFRVVTGGTGSTGGNHVNFISVQPGATSYSPNVLAQGSDANIDLTLQPKGSGTVYTTSRLNVSNSLPSLIQSISSPGTELTLAQTGDVFGATTLRLQNRNGLNGALFENNSLGLVDFGFKNTSAQRNIRFESRGGGYKLLSAGDGSEFQIGDPSSPSFVIGSTGVLVNKTTTSTSTTTGALIVNGGAGIAGNVTAAAVVVNGIELYNYSSAAYTQANAGITLAQSATVLAQAGFNQANTGIVLAQAGFNQANTGTVLAQAGFNQANTGVVLAQSAFNAANNASPSGLLANTILFANSSGYLANNNNLQYISSNNTIITNATINANVVYATTIKSKQASVSANNIDLSTGDCFSKTVSSNVTFTVSNVPPTGTIGSFILDITNGGSNTIVWMANTKWASQTAPTLTTSGRDILGFFTYDSGITWNGLVIARDIK
jgi:hypothetical protein